MVSAVSAGKIVNLIYSLKNADGRVLDRSDAENPFVYLHGAKQIVPGLEKALNGMRVGDKKKVVVPAAMGYGEKDPALRMVVERKQFPEGTQIKVGMQFEVPSDDGHDALGFLVESVHGDKIHIDGNHPLAGQTLYFEVEVIGIRDATEEEKSHGHAHGPDGHHH